MRHMILKCVTSGKNQMIKQIDARVQPTDLSIVETKTNRGVLFQMSMKAKFTDRLNRGFVIHAEMTLDNKLFQI